MARRLNHFSDNELQCSERLFGTTFRNVGKASRSSDQACRNSDQARRNSGKSCRDSGKPCRSSGKACRNSDRPCRNSGKACRNSGKACRDSGKAWRNSDRPCRNSGKAYRNLDRPCRNSDSPPRNSYLPKRSSDQASRTCESRTYAMNADALKHAVLGRAHPYPDTKVSASTPLQPFSITRCILPITLQLGANRCAACCSPSCSASDCPAAQFHNQWRASYSEDAAPMV